MFDIHAHLTAPELSDRLEELLIEASRAGVSDVMVVAEDLEDAAKVLELPGVCGGVRLHKAIGLHPEKANLDALPVMLDLIRRHSDQLACVGEIGLDYSPHVLGSEAPEEVKSLQQHVMREQVRLAKDLGKAVNVHSRSAGHHAISLLEAEGATRAVLHAFDGKPHYAERAASALGYYLSVPPCVARSPSMQKMVKRLPVHSLLLETDAPALAAEKGVVNVPSALRVSCEQVAALKGLSTEEVALTTAESAQRLFFGTAPS